MHVLQPLSVYNNFCTLIIKTIGHRRIFIFCHLTYIVQLLYLGKLLRPSVKINFKNIRISQEDAILILKSLSVKGVW